MTSGMKRMRKLILTKLTMSRQKGDETMEFSMMTAIVLLLLLLLTLNLTLIHVTNVERYLRQVVEILHKLNDSKNGAGDER